VGEPIFPGRHGGQINFSWPPRGTNQFFLAATGDKACLVPTCVVYLVVQIIPNS